MPIYKKADLLDIIAQSIQECGWNILYLSATHPFKIRIYRENESETLKIIIYNLTHGGGYKRPVDEYRIQIKEPKLEEEYGYKTLIIGYWDEIGVFAGFDLKRHLGVPGYSASLQIKEDALQKAQTNGFAVCDKGNKEIAVAFRPDFFVEYVRNLEQLHTFGNVRRDFEILEHISAKPFEVNEEILQQVSSPRRSTVQTISRHLRDSGFKHRVLTAYNNKCAICSLQLKLVDAAHILPVSHEKSTDETCNGIALCALHHRAYDLSLVTFDEVYKVHYYRSKLVRLRQIGFDGGMDKFIDALQKNINTPPVKNNRPHKAYVIEANRIRGWAFTS
jgi:putative restriction endonuclease